MKHSLVALAAALLGFACNPAASPVSPSSAGPGESSPGSASLSSSARSVPFKGRFEGTQTVTPLAPPFGAVAGSATGTGTHLGRFTLSFPHTVNFATRVGNGTLTFTAANGDTLSASFTGQATPQGATVSIVEQATVAGGTGRFAGATGSFVVERTFDPAAGATWGSFSGAISFQG